MKKSNLKYALLFAAFVCVWLITGCDFGNPIMEKWWVDQPQYIEVERVREVLGPQAVFTVSFDMNGGRYIDETDGDTMAKPQKILSGGNASDPGLLVKDNSFFGGWYTEKDGGSEWVFTENPVTQDITLYARWIETGYTVKFDLNLAGTTLAADDISYQPLDEYIAAGARAVEPLEFVIADTDSLYNFRGWYTGTNLETAELWDFSSYKVDQFPDLLTGDTITLYAWWAEMKAAPAPVAEYTIKFNTNNPTASEGDQPVDQYLLDGARIVAPYVAPREGYAFGGWYYLAAGDSLPWNFADPVSGGTTGERTTITLSARWVEQSYTITFDATGGIPVPAPQQISSGGKAAQPETPAKTGNGFGGWYINYDSGTYTNEWDFNMPVASDTTLYAKWDVVFSNVTFNDGGQTDPQQIVLGGKVIEPADPAPPTGFDFVGWYTDDGRQWNFETDTIIQDMVDNGLVLEPRWSNTEFTTTFAVNDADATIPPAQDIIYGGRVAEPEIARPGYNLEGWYTTDPDSPYFDPESDWEFANDTVTSDVTLYPKWEQVVSYGVVTFNKNEGSDSANLVSYIPLARTVPSGEKLVDVPPAVRPNYIFGGWYTNSLCTTAWNPDTAVTANTELFAKWNPESFTVSYDNGGTTVTEAVKPGSHFLARELDANPGHTLEGWYKDNDNNPATTIDFATAARWDPATDVVTENLTLYPNWVADAAPVTITFNAGFTPSPTDFAPPPQRVNSGGKLINVAAVRSGYAFEGWYTSSAYTTAWNFDTPVTADRELFAKWNQLSYVVRYIDGGNETVTRNVLSGDSAPQPDIGTKTGYTHSPTDWYKDADLTIPWDFATEKITSDTTLYADWTINFYTASFDLNYPSNIPAGTAPDAQTRPYNMSFSPPAKITLTGYAFGGWYKDPRCRAGDVYDFSTPATDDITLYAKWTLTVRQVKVRFDMLGGTYVDLTEPIDIVPPEQTVLLGGKATSPGLITREGYFSQGWYNAKTGREWNFATDSITADDFDAATGYMTLRAGWQTDDGYTVIFDLNGMKSGDVTYEPWDEKIAGGKFVSEPTGFGVKDPDSGYTFLGWFTDPECTPESRWNFSTTRLDYTTSSGDGMLGLFAGWARMGVQFSNPVYVIKWATNGASGTQPADQYKGEGDRIASPPAQSYSGYAFGGWYTNSSLSGVPWNFSRDYIKSDYWNGDVDDNGRRIITLYAKWTSESFEALLQDITVIEMHNVNFAGGQTEYDQTPDNISAIDLAASLLNGNPNYRVMLIGHSDGNPETSSDPTELSADRANFVKEQLEESMNPAVNKNLIIVKGVGGKYVLSNPELAHQVEIVIFDIAQ